MKNSTSFMIETALFGVLLSILLLFFVGLSAAQATTLGSVSKAVGVAKQSLEIAKGVRRQVTGGAGNGKEIPVCAKDKPSAELLGLPTCANGCIIESSNVYTRDCLGALQVGFYNPKPKKTDKQAKKDEPVDCTTDADCCAKNPSLCQNERFPVPYMVTMDTVTPAALAACRADSNCMDIESFR